LTIHLASVEYENGIFGLNLAFFSTNFLGLWVEKVRALWGETAYSAWCAKNGAIGGAKTAASGLLEQARHRSASLKTEAARERAAKRSLDAGGRVTVNSQNIRLRINPRRQSISIKTMCFKCPDRGSQKKAEVKGLCKAHFKDVCGHLSQDTTTCSAAHCWCRVRKVVKRSGPVLAARDGWKVRYSEWEAEPTAGVEASVFPSRGTCRY
jgi:hypothetical protein